MEVIIILFIICIFLLCVDKLKYFLHMMQLEGYKSFKYIKWIKSNKDKIHNKNDIIYVLISIVFATIMFLKQIEDEKIFFTYTIIFTFLTFVFFIINKMNKYESKKPLIFTSRAKRLFFIINLVLAMDIIFSIIIIRLFTQNLNNIFVFLCGSCALMYYFCAYYIVLANDISIPIENKINKRFYYEAMNKIKDLKNITSIGITGSYGKTSTKFFMYEILKIKYNVLKTPESYNTPMGISKVINNELTDEHEIFIAELGATHIGDISEVAILTSPKIGVITSIGPCHLETFKSIDNIMRTKYELIEALPDEGVAVFNYDNEHIKKLADKTFKEKILYGIDNIEDVDIFATDISTDEKGSKFTLCIDKLGVIECSTKLLGKHNISNILAGVSVAYTLGMSLEQIKEGIKNIESVPHRLELINPGTGVLVIDDAFNSNPDGAKAALEVLDSFSTRRKIIVTPGMIELGDIENIEHEKFGRDIAKICDIAILVGKNRTKSIKKGIEEIGFDLKNLHVVNSLDEATKLLSSITRVNDVVLFENDLPDIYNEN